MFYMILGGLLGFWLGAKKKLGMIVDYTLLGILWLIQCSNER